MEKTLAYYVTLLRKDFTVYCNEILQELGLSQGLVFFVLYIGNHPGCSPKELAHNLAMDTGHVTRSLAKLEQGGFVSQQCDDKDRRARVLRLQERGEEAFRVSHELFGRWDEAVMQSLTENEKSLLLSTLNRLTKQKEGHICVRNDVQAD